MSVIDERTAGFLAVGAGRRECKPTAVVTSSGTAVANLLPAVVEASMTRTPLLIITADRPSEMIGSGCNQAIFQEGIFGVYPNSAIEIEPPNEDTVLRDDLVKVSGVVNEAR